MLDFVALSKMKPAEAQAALNAERAASAAALAAAQAAAAKGNGKVTMKVSVKGALSLYGINGKFPVTMYREQWTRVLDMAEDIRGFITANSKPKPDYSTKDKDGKDIVAKAYLVVKAD